jgi:secreted trypsin-like serine protease
MFRLVNPAVNFYRALLPTNYIVNGEQAVAHEFPWMAALMNLQRQFCGGSLIDENHILTAAHCVAHMSKYDVQNLRVRLGDHNIKDNDSQTVVKHVKRVIRHKGFSSSTLWNDVAILTLDSAVQYSDTIQPICLAQGSQTYVNNIVTVAGWGTLREGGSQPSSLMKVDVKVWTNERCKSSYGSSAPGGITSHMLCASEYNKDSCSGDSGGPLFDCPYGGPCEQIGIVSWGIGCAKAKYPGVYTRVTEMMPWIQRIVEQY